ncbi:hypothetical protein ABGB12_25080 [Actinocorallia sp. B10E7]|uniref:SbtR family transcriptional regulator n=1 Tax=Actinocorallia sp. B10E7 TaxID=3153558 RepID=UPI00325E2AB9
MDVLPEDTRSIRRERSEVGRGVEAGEFQAGGGQDDVDGLDLFSLVNAIAWISGRSPVVAVRRDHLLDLVLDGLTAPGNPT